MLRQVKIDPSRELPTYGARRMTSWRPPLCVVLGVLGVCLFPLLSSCRQSTSDDRQSSVSLETPSQPQVPAERSYFAFDSNGVQTMFVRAEARPNEIFLFDKTLGTTARYVLPAPLFVDRGDIAISLNGEFLAAIARAEPPVGGRPAHNPSELLLISTRDGSARSIGANAERAFFFPRFTQRDRELLYWGTLDHLPGWHFDGAAAPSSDVTLYAASTISTAESLKFLAKQLDTGAATCPVEELLPLVFEIPAQFAPYERGSTSGIVAESADILTRDIRCLQSKLTGTGFNRTTKTFGLAIPKNASLYLEFDKPTQATAEIIPRPLATPGDARVIGATARNELTWKSANSFWIAGRTTEAETFIGLAAAEYPKMTVSGTNFVEVIASGSPGEIAQLKAWDMSGQPTTTNIIPMSRETYAVTIAR